MNFRYFVRASFGNPKGFGPYSAATPKSVVPSSWRTVDERVPRVQNQLQICRDAMAAVATEDDYYEPQQQHQHQQHRLFPKKRGGLRHLFSSSSAPKFQRSLLPHRAYLCCVFFHEDKVLMTNEENLPVMEIADEFPTGINAEHAWFASKLCQAWKDVERLKHEAAKSSSSAHGFRYKLLQCSLNMQQTLGVHDLGTAYHTPFRTPDGEGSTVIFTTVNHVRHPKHLVSLSLKWVPLSKAQRRCGDDMDRLRVSLREQILFQQVSAIDLNQGLYLCYLQAESSVDSLSIIVSNTSPSILPYTKVRRFCQTIAGFEFSRVNLQRAICLAFLWPPVL